MSDKTKESEVNAEVKEEVKATDAVEEKTEEKAPDTVEIEGFDENVDDDLDIDITMQTAIGTHEAVEEELKQVVEDTRSLKEDMEKIEPDPVDEEDLSEAVKEDVEHIVEEKEEEKSVKESFAGDMDKLDDFHIDLDTVKYEGEQLIGKAKKAMSNIHKTVSEKISKDCPYEDDCDNCGFCSESKSSKDDEAKDENFIDDVTETLEDKIECFGNKIVKNKKVIAAGILGTATVILGIIGYKALKKK